MPKLRSLVVVLLLVGPLTGAAQAEPGCRNSFDPQCGPFSWSPEPAPNDRGTASIAVTPDFPKPGEAVTFTITIDDPDSGSATHAERVRTRYGDEQAPPNDIHCDPAWVFGFGPWDTPAEQPFHEVVTLQHTYSAAGDYHAAFDFDLCGAGPYREEYRVDATVPVRNLPDGLMVCIEVRAADVAGCV